MRRLNKYVEFEPNSITVVDDDEGFYGLDCNVANTDDLQCIIEDIKLEDIGSVYPELKACYTEVEFDYLVDDEGDIQSIAIKADNIANKLSEAGIDYNIAEIDGQQYITIPENTIAVSVDYDDDPDTGEIVFITRK